MLKGKALGYLSFELVPETFDYQLLFSPINFYQLLSVVTSFSVVTVDPSLLYSLSCLQTWMCRCDSSYKVVWTISKLIVIPYENMSIARNCQLKTCLLHEHVYYKDFTV